MRRYPWNEYGSNDGVEWSREPDGTVYWWDEAQQAWELYGSQTAPASAVPPEQWEAAEAASSVPRDVPFRDASRYPMLEKVATLYAVAAWVIAVLAAAGFVISLFRLGDTGLSGFIGLVISVVMARWPSSCCSGCHKEFTY